MSIVLRMPAQGLAIHTLLGFAPKLEQEPEKNIVHDAEDHLPIDNTS